MPIAPCHPTLNANGKASSIDVNKRHGRGWWIPSGVSAWATAETLAPAGSDSREPVKRARHHASRPTIVQQRSTAGFYAYVSTPHGFRAARGDARVTPHVTPTVVTAILVTSFVCDCVGAVGEIVETNVHEVSSAQIREEAEAIKSRASFAHAVGQWKRNARTV